MYGMCHLCGGLPTIGRAIFLQPVAETFATSEGKKKRVESQYWRCDGLRTAAKKATGGKKVPTSPTCTKFRQKKSV